ncbi:MAG: PulJ/GspJ family protein [Pirellulaceae bacterium]
MVRWPKHLRMVRSGVSLRGQFAAVRADRTPVPSGYTLLELLIVGVLVSVLMIGVWSLFRTWSGLYERGERRVLRIQLVRSLGEQFTEDVRAATQIIPSRPWRDPAPISAPAATNGNADTSAGGNMALMGEADWLMLEVVQAMNPWQMSAEEPSDPATTTTATTTTERATLTAPELRLVLYTFAPPESETPESLSAAVDEMAAADDTETIVGEAEQAQPLAGLQRVVIAQEYLGAWSEAAANRMDASAGSGSPRAAVFWVRDEVTGVGTRDAQAGGLGLPEAGREQGDDSDTDLLKSILERDDVAEVVWMEFRYFDGASWQGSWNSESQGRLPVAIEMRYELKIEEPAKKNESAGDDDTELVDAREPVAFGDATGRANGPSETPRMDDAAAFDAGKSERGEEVATPYYRCVVFLHPANKSN